jgi:hypothetical protein
MYCDCKCLAYCCGHAPCTPSLSCRQRTAQLPCFKHTRLLLECGTTSFHIIPLLTNAQYRYIQHYFPEHYTVRSWYLITAQTRMASTHSTSHLSVERCSHGIGIQFAIYSQVRQRIPSLSIVKLRSRYQNVALKRDNSHIALLPQASYNVLVNSNCFP